MIVACFGVDVFWVCWFDCLAVVVCCGYGLDSGCCLMIMVGLLVSVGVADCVWVWFVALVSTWV